MAGKGLVTFEKQKEREKGEERKEKKKERKESKKKEEENGKNQGIFLAKNW